METKTIFESRIETREDYQLFENVMGEGVACGYEKQFQIGRGIQGQVFHIITDSVTNLPERQTYLYFSPIDEHELYVTLTFFPDVNLKEDEEFFKVVRLTFEPEFFQQWDYSVLLKKEPFRFDRSTEQAIFLKPCTFEAISHLMPIPSSEEDFATLLQRKESAIFLLRLSLESFINSNEANQMPACSFLNNSFEREKVMEAYEIIMNNLDSPKTIKELARMVGMNECYLKKGFKITFGKTIHKFQQQERIEKAKDLLLKGKYSISEVAFKMGFGSASHFSSSFKKISGLRPCDVLS